MPFSIAFGICAIGIPSSSAATRAVSTKATRGWTLPQAMLTVSSETEKKTASMAHATSLMPKNAAKGTPVLISIQPAP